MSYNFEKELSQVYTKGLKLIENDKKEDLLKNKFLFHRPELLNNLKKDFENYQDSLPKDLYELEKKVIESIEKQIDSYQKRYDNKIDVLEFNQEINNLVTSYLNTIKKSDRKDIYIEILTDTESSEFFIDYLYSELLLEDNSIKLHYKGNMESSNVQNTFTMKSSDYVNFCSKFVELKKRYPNNFSGRIQIDFVPPLLTHKITDSDVEKLAIENAGFVNSQNLGLGSIHLSCSSSLTPQNYISAEEELKINLNTALQELFRNYDKNHGSLFRKCDYVYTEEDEGLDGENVDINKEVILYNKRENNLNNKRKQKI